MWTKTFKQLLDGYLLASKTENDFQQTFIVDYKKAAEGV